MNYSLSTYLFFNLLYFVMLILLMMIGMAFLTLFERKLLGYIQNRKGPNKVGAGGLLQPFSDVIKLTNKEFFFVDKINVYLYSLSVAFMLLLAVAFWVLYPFFVNGCHMNVGMMYLLSILSLGVYPVMIGGWSSNCTYSMLGAIRSIAQSVSFEVSLFLMLFSMIFLIESFSLPELIKFQESMKFIYILWPIYFMFMISLLIELNRTPFDLAEGESELVSGFNTEYFSGSFALIFMSEYLSILFMSFLVSFMFVAFCLYSFQFFCVWFFHVYVIIWLRGVLPRIRYDDLMYMCWKKFLTVALVYLILIYSMKVYMQMVG